MGGKTCDIRNGLGFLSQSARIELEQRYGIQLRMNRLSYEWKEDGNGGGEDVYNHMTGWIEWRGLHQALELHKNKMKLTRHFGA